MPKDCEWDGIESDGSVVEQNEAITMCVTMIVRSRDHKEKEHEGTRHVREDGNITAMPGD